MFEFVHYYLHDAFTFVMTTFVLVILSGMIIATYLEVRNK